MVRFSLSVAALAMLTLGVFAPGASSAPAAEPTHARVPAEPAPPSAAASPGQHVYVSYCAACHGKSGNGKGIGAKGLDPPPTDFTRSEKMTARTDDFLFKVIKEGGAATGLSSTMVSWGPVLRDPQIREVVAYIRTLAK